MPNGTEPRFPPHRLAAAINKIIEEAEEWGRLVRQFEALPAGAPAEMRTRYYDLADNAKRQTAKSAKRAVECLPGVDRYVQDGNGTRPGQWSSEVKGKLEEFYALCFQYGQGMVYTADQQRQTTFEAEWRDWLWQQQKMLRSIDRSAFVWKWVKEHPALLLGGLMILILVLLGLVVVAWRKWCLSVGAFGVFLVLLGRLKK